VWGGSGGRGRRFSLLGVGGGGGGGGGGVCLFAGGGDGRLLSRVEGFEFLVSQESSAPA